MNTNIETISNAYKAANAILCEGKSAAHVLAYIAYEAGEAILGFTCFARDIPDHQALYDYADLANEWENLAFVIVEAMGERAAA